MSWNLKELTPAERLALLAPTLKVFHARYGYFIMPFQFVTPEDQESDNKQADQVGDVWDESWPPKARGERLGTTLHAFMKSESQRDKNPGIVEALSDIGFPVDVEWKQYVFERVPLAALSTYRALHGNCQVPQSFAVPTGDARWPIETWGLNLGNFVSWTQQASHRSLTQEQLDALGAVGMSLNLNELPFIERLPLLAPTLRAFHARHDHFIMDASFVVPEEADSNFNPKLPPYPRATRGMNIGTTLRRFLLSEQRRQKHPNVLQELEEIGFPVNVEWKDYLFERQLLPAFRAYRELHGHWRVPYSFVVPTGDTKWPIETWGLKHGNHANRSQSSRRRSLRLEQLDALAAVGFPLHLNELSLADRLQLLASTLRAFHARHGHFIMHATYVVPREDDSNVNPHLPPFPREARGVKLGYTLHHFSSANRGDKNTRTWYKSWKGSDFP